MLNGWKFRDQPSGRCGQCKWNVSANNALLCNVPQVYLHNPVCIAKLQLAVLRNIDWELARANDDGEEWREDE